MNKHLQYPLDRFWVSDKTRDTLTLGTLEDFQEMYSPGNGEIEVIGKDEILLNLPFKDFKINLILHPMQIYKEGDIKKGEPIGFALEGHVEVHAIKINTTTYKVNPLSVLFVHTHQAYTNSVPYATPKTLIR